MIRFLRLYWPNLTAWVVVSTWALFYGPRG